MKYDILISNANVIDGSGEPAYLGCVAIKDDEIAYVGESQEGMEAAEYLDAKGRFVTPGFIDIHTHIDMEYEGMSIGVQSDRYLENMIRQGVTTAIGGNCGYSVIEVGKFIDRLNQGNTGINVGTLMGHGMLRMAVAGMENRQVTEAEMEVMKGMLRKAMEEGAFGLTSGLGYSPGNYSSPEEMIPLCKIVQEYNGMYASHIRNQDRNVRESWDEIIEVGRQSGVRPHISHLQVIGEECWGAAKELIGKLEAAREEGIMMTADAFPYEGAGWSVVGVLIPNWAQACEGEGGQFGSNETMKARLRDEALLPRIKAEIEDLIGLRGGVDGILFVGSAEMPEINCKYLGEVCKMWDMEPVDVILKIALETSVVGGTGFQCCYEDKKDFYLCEYAAVGSDASSTLASKFDNSPNQPRAYGCFPRFIETYVKDNAVFTIEEAVRKMTSLPADIVKITDRGLLKEGMKADVVIMDYDAIKDNASYTDSNHYPSGIDTVIVNGKVAILEGTHQRILSGVGLKYQGK